MGLIQSALNDTVGRYSDGKPIPPYPADTTTAEGKAKAVAHKEAHVVGGYKWGGRVDYCVVENGLPGRVVLGRASLWCPDCKFVTLNNPSVLKGLHIEQARANPHYIQGCWTSSKQILSSFDESHIRRVMNENKPSEDGALQEAADEAAERCPVF